MKVQVHNYWEIIIHHIDTIIRIYIYINMGSYQCSIYMGSYIYYIYIYGILYIFYHIYTQSPKNSTVTSPNHHPSWKIDCQIAIEIKQKTPLKTKDPSSWSTCWPLPPVNQPHAPMTCGRRRFDSPQPSLGDGSPTVKNTTWLENGTYHFNAQDFYKNSTLEYLKYILS